MTKPKHKQKPSQIGWAQAFRDVLVASMNRGQFPLAVFSLLIGLLIYKMPPEKVSELVFMLIDMLYRGEMLAYIFCFLTLSGWFFHAKWQRRMITGEMRRISNERTAAQGAQIGNHLIKSSGEVL